jgi:phage tail-like protein
MALPDVDSSVGHSFGLEFDGVVIKQIVEVSGLKIDQDVVEFKQNTDRGKFIVKKLPGRPKAGEVTLTRGLTHDSSFDDWIRDSQFGKVPEARKGGAIIVFDFEGNAIRRYNLINAWPKKLEIRKRKAGDTVVLAEKLTLTYRGCEVSET